MASGALQVMSSGNWLPVIDLTQLDPKLVEAAADADVIILEGVWKVCMGSAYDDWGACVTAECSSSVQSRWTQLLMWPHVAGVWMLRLGLIVKIVD